MCYKMRGHCHNAETTMPSFRTMVRYTKVQVNDKSIAMNAKSDPTFYERNNNMQPRIINSRAVIGVCKVRQARGLDKSP